MSRYSERRYGNDWTNESDRDDDRFGRSRERWNQDSYRNRGYRDRSDDDDRGFFERAGDEIKSWFGDDEAERRRRQDDMERYSRGGSDYDSDYYRRSENDYDRDVNWTGRQGRSDYDRRFGRGDYERYSSDRGNMDRSWNDSDRRNERWDRPQNYRGESSRDWDRGGFNRGYTGSGSMYENRESGSRQGSFRDDSSTHTWSTHGPHAGIGPKGYTRSSDRIREDVNERLKYHGHVDASDIDVSVEGDVVTLKGTVPDRSMKRLAEEIAESISGVRDVHNQLQVNRQQDTWSGQSGSAQFSGQSGSMNTMSSSGSSGSQSVQGQTEMKNPASKGQSSTFDPTK